MHTNTTKQINKANKRRLKDRARCAMVSKEEIEATKKMETFLVLKNNMDIIIISKMAHNLN